MRRRLRIPLGMALILVAASGQARAQYGRWHYPGGYGGYGWGGWNVANDPASGYMAGLGAFARGRGAYEVSDAQARSINTDTVLRWNKALLAHQRAVQLEQQAQDAKTKADLQAQARQGAIDDGERLNTLLDRVLEFNPSGARGASASATLGPDAIRDIPFASATEAITVCLDQMTAEDAWPSILQDDRFAGPRLAIRQAVKQALAEDAKGDVAPETLKRIDAAVTDLRARFLKATGDLEIAYADADDFTKGLTGLSRMLGSPKLKPMLAELETYKGSTVGDLIAFMQAFNLRFGPAMSGRQRDIYNQLVPMFERVLADTGRPDASPPAAQSVAATGKSLGSAARDVFKGMSWKHLNAQPQPE